MSKAVNYERVAQAAEAIKSRGERPSLSNISNFLGPGAMCPELAPLLDMWYSKQPEFQRNVEGSVGDIHIKSDDVLRKNIELEKSLSLVRATLESTADGILMINDQGQVVDWNKKFIEMWRIPIDLIEAGPESLGFEYILDQVKDPTSLISEVERLYKNPMAQGELGKLYFKDGRIFERYSQPHMVGDDIVGRVWSFRDVTQHALAEDALRIRERAIESSSLGVFIVDVVEEGCPIIYVNPAFEKITDYRDQDILGKNVKILQGRDQDQVNQKRIDLAFREAQSEEVVLKSYRKMGELFWNEMSVSPVHEADDAVKYFVGTINDITRRKEMEEQLIQQATHDALTNLPNRSLLIDRVEQAIINARHDKKQVAMLFLDLDRFKMVNDSLGHSMGDILLQSVSNRLILCIRESDTLARIGGDEFIIVMPSLDDQSEAVKMADKVLDELAKPFQVKRHSLKLTASIGICFYPGDGKDYESLMKNSDLSMYHAKDQGRNTLQVYTEAMKEKMVSQVKLESGLRNALELSELFLQYQPLVDLKTGLIVGNEALLRWNSAKLGLVPPLEFISLAEETGLILEIGEWVLEQACIQNRLWHQQGLDHLIVAVNISGRQFKHEKLALLVEKVLNKTGFDAGSLELELTETLLVEELDATVDMMHQLKDMGVSVVIDDFGTGYSALSYLKQFPVDKLKIDRSFVRDVVDNQDDAAITRAIINLGHSLNMNVLAEGVETPEHKKFLIENGCDYAQGYYFSEPRDAGDISKMLMDDNKKRHH